VVYFGVCSGGLLMAAYQSVTQRKADGINVDT
jgi:hypothetical protein